MTYKCLSYFKQLSIYLLVNILILVSKDSSAQSLYADFDVESITCLNQKLSLKNNSSSDATTFFWDLCLTDIQAAPTVKLLGAAGSISNLGAIDVVNDNQKWYGFIPGRGDNHLYRLDFGTVLTNGFTLVDLGDFGGALNMPKNLKIIKENGQWNGLLVNVSNSLVRLSFTNGLSQTPIVENLGNLGRMNAPIGLDIVRDGTDYVALISSYGGVLSIINFGTSILNTPSLSNIYSFGVSPVSGPVGISLVKDSDDVWRGIISSYNDGKIYRVNFDNGLYQFPNFTSLTTVSNPTETRLVFEGGEYYGFVVNQVGNLLRIKFGESILSGGEIFESLGNFGSLYNLDAFSLVKYNGTWNGFAADRVTGNVYNFSFFSECNYVNTDQSEDVEPIGIKYSASGNYHISLMAFDNLGNSVEVTKPIEVNGIIAPEFAIAIENACVQNMVGFSVSGNPAYNIISFEWDFGDNQISSQESPNHIYNSSGEFNVKFNGATDNGCKNSTSVIHKVYNPPSPSFDLPSGTICTNNEFTFTNSTIDNFDGKLTYEWFVNNVKESTTRDLKYVFHSENDQQIKLKTSIPGCSSELTQTLLNVKTGPVVGFSYIGKCEDETIKFTNESAGSISGFQWDFGNGNTSTLENPSETFVEYGNYNISLLTTGTNGCISTLTKPVNIYSVPQTNFSLDLPPFSCSESLSQFNDLTPPMADSNIASWVWSFGDQAGGIASQKNPLYTYSLAGDYSVSLITRSNFGCSNSIQKTVTIYPSPKADFSFKNACVNQSSQFSDSSTGDIKSWLWTIQSSTYSVKDPIHIFKSSANHTALLTVTGTNNCISQISKNVNVPIQVVADFTASGTCATKPALFDEISKGGADPAVSWRWDFDGQISSTEMLPIQFTFPSIGNKSVTMQTTRASGCTYSTTQDIFIEEPPKAWFTIFLESGASPFTVDLTNKSTQASKYLWKPGDPKQSTSTLYSPSFTYTELGDYLIELEASNELGCKDQWQQLIHVVVPQINAAVSNFKLEKVPGSDSWKSVVTIENKSNVALIDPDIYLDISGSALISEKITGVIKPSSSLTYTFTPSILPRAVDYACAEIKISSDEYQFDNRQCVNVSEQYTSIAPYPNPANDELILEWINISSEPMDIIIYNVSGQTIISKQYMPTLKGLNQVKVDVSNLQVGIYFVSYSVDDQTQNFKFSVVR